MKWIVLLVVLALGIGGFIFFSQAKNKTSTDSTVVSPTETIPSKSVDFTASFTIVTNGTVRIFTDPKYHNKSPDVFITEDNTNTVLVKKSGVRWNDFFKTLPMSLEKDCLVTGTGQTFCTNDTHRLLFYINGIEDKDALGKTIGQNDQLEVRYEAKE